MPVAGTEAATGAKESGGLEKRRVVEEGGGRGHTRVRTEAQLTTSRTSRPETSSSRMRKRKPGEEA
jgi:hypothetical protein